MSLSDVELRALSGLTGLYDAEVLASVTNTVYALYMGDFGSQQFDLRMWKREIPKRKWRRWRGRVKAGKPIPVWCIVFDPVPTGRALPTPFVKPL